MKIRFSLAMLLGSLILLVSCYKEVLEITANKDDASREGLEDWTAATHSKSGNPDYDIVFDNSKINRLDIVIEADEWQAMQDDLDDVQASGGGGGPGGGFSDQTPLYFPCQVYHNNIQWYNVGIRYKGNSSLSSTYRNNNGKKPLRLEFDEFEDTYPEIEDQRFYGFKELSLSNNFDDKSMMREKIGNEIYREFGVPAPHAAYYEIYVDHGNGPVYFGVYTVVEVVFNTMLEKQFGSKTGNCYKPDGNGAKWSTSGWDLDHFEKKTNKDFLDKSEISEMYDILHSSNRTSNTSQWMKDLEAVFDVDGFLKWQAANNTMQNWDTYGRMTHNYYLYHDPADDLIKWIPWDNNEAFQSGKMGGSLAFDFQGLSASEWPLLGFLMDMPEYKTKFDNHIRDFITNVFEPSRMEAKYNADMSLLQTSASNEQSGYTFLNGAGDFSSAVSTLISHVSQRETAAKAYLD